MTEIWFYHLEDSSLEQVLPRLLTASLSRDWRVVVQTSSTERVEALCAHLWSYQDDAFLPHGSSRDGFGAHQPIWLTSQNDTPNSAKVRFFVDGAKPEIDPIFSRIIVLFDGKNQTAVLEARKDWKVFHATDHPVSYWRQDIMGKWNKQL